MITVLLSRRFVLEENPTTTTPLNQNKKIKGRKKKENSSNPKTFGTGENKSGGKISCVYYTTRSRVTLAARERDGRGSASIVYRWSVCGALKAPDTDSAGRCFAHAGPVALGPFCWRRERLAAFRRTDPAPGPRMSSQLPQENYSWRVVRLGIVFLFKLPLSCILMKSKLSKRLVIKLILNVSNTSKKKKKQVPY